MEVVFIILIIILIAAGVIFSVLPPLPGPIISFGALLLMHFTISKVSAWGLIIMAVMTVMVTVIDYVLPIAATRKFGGTQAGVWGGIIGLLVAVFFPILGPWGIILGPLLGAIIGDLIGGNRFQAALKSGFGSFLGFLAATSLKVIFSIVVGLWVAFEVFGILIGYVEDLFS